MGEAINFILQRFYYLFGHGCILNIYVLWMLFVMGKVKFLPKYIELFGNIKFSTTIFILFFTLVAVFIGVFIEGIVHSLLRCYRDKAHKKKTRIFYILKFIFKCDPEYACKRCWIEERKKQRFGEKIKTSMSYDFKFMYNHRTSQLYSKNEIYPRMRATALRIAKEAGSDVFRYREQYYLAHGMFLIFLLIAVVSFVLAPCVVIVGIAKGCISSWMNLIVFYAASFFTSVGFMAVTKFMAWGFANRFVRKVGEWYNALGMDKEVAKNECKLPAKC